jgi:hypothetical protein
MRLDTTMGKATIVVLADWRGLATFTATGRPKGDDGQAGLEMTSWVATSELSYVQRFVVNINHSANLTCHMN